MKIIIPTLVMKELEHEVGVIARWHEELIDEHERRDARCEMRTYLN